MRFFKKQNQWFFNAWNVPQGIPRRHKISKDESLFLNQFSGLWGLIT